MTQQFPSKRDGKVRRISALLFLHLACEHQHLGCGVLYFELNGGLVTYFKMVAASEVMKVLSIWLTTIFLRAMLFKKI